MVSPSDQRPLRIVAAPLHAPTATRRQVHRPLELGADSVAYTEAYPHIPYLRRRPMWHIAVGESATSLRGPGDVPVLVHRRNKPIERWAIKACDAALPLELAPERWLTGFAYDHPFGAIEHIGAHPNPYRAPKATLSLRRAYRDNMEALEHAIQVSRAHGRLPVVTGDLNLSQASSLAYAPRALFESVGLAYWNVGVVWIAYHRSLVPLERRRITDNGQDHPTLVMDFESFRREGSTS